VCVCFWVCFFPLSLLCLLFFFGPLLTWIWVWIFGFDIAKWCRFLSVWVGIFCVDIAKMWRLWDVLVLIINVLMVSRNGFQILW
jgi:hypothetical protein